jgi:CubicO group peptidase (beta-lactamase class C family)
MKHTMVFGTALALALLAAPVAAQSPGVPEPVYAPPESVGIDPQRLKHLTDFIERKVESKEIPGAVVLVARHGKIVLYQGYGRLDPARPDPMPRDAIFRIMSMTKPITAVAALRFAERGEIQLSDPLAKYLPAFQSMQVFDERRVTGNTLPRLTRPAETGISIYDLLRHVAGLADEVNYDGYVGQRFRDAGIGNADLTLAQAVDKVATIPLLTEPGSTFSYSETSFTVLGRVLEVIAGKPIATVFSGELFEPLGMTDTGFLVPPEKADRLAQGFPPADQEARRALFDAAQPRRYHSTAAGLVSTALDYWRFVQMLLDEGRDPNGDAVLSPVAVDTMMTNSLAGTAPGLYYFFDGTALGFTYGLGIGVKLPDSASPFLTGRRTFFWVGAAGTLFFADRDRDLTGIVLTQKPGFESDYHNVIGTLIMQSAID